jgi:hypothetical protein
VFKPYFWDRARRARPASYNMQQAKMYSLRAEENRMSDPDAYEKMLGLAAWHHSQAAKYLRAAK